MALHLHRAPRADLLADQLGALLSVPLADPFASEVVVVPARGIERWLAQRLSHSLGVGSGRDGVCAGVRFLSPRSLVSLLLERERDDVWDPDRMVWPLLETRCLSSRSVRHDRCIVVTWEFAAGWLSLALNPSDQAEDVACSVPPEAVSTGAFEQHDGTLRLGPWSAVAWAVPRG